jgi:dihydrofolate synthase/folylpolyglutamate synthase
MNYSEALEYIHSINWTFTKPGLERISFLCEKLGDPQKELKFVHVAGTNGKGSFCSMLDSVLRAAGYKTGLFTSPYIKEFNERIRYCGENIPNDELAEITEYIKPFADAMEDKPTEFELITAIGLEYFKRKKCDVVVLEAGMGGRLDSTNVISESVLSVITGISLEHTDYLGDTVEKIAAEKAGIIKSGGRIIYGGEDDSAAEVIENIAKARSAKYGRVDRSTLKILSSTLSGTYFSYKSYDKVELSLLGLYQPQNATNVIDAVEALRECGFDISNEALFSGLAAAEWPARFEIVCKDPLVIYDGAHNPQGIEIATESIKRYFGDKKVCVLTGVMKDKDYDYIASRLASVASDAFTVTPNNPRALGAEEYASVLKSNGVNAMAFDNVKDAVAEAKKEAREKNTALVCLGSLYMYAEIYDFLK